MTDDKRMIDGLRYWRDLIDTDPGVILRFLAPRAICPVKSHQRVAATSYIRSPSLLLAAGLHGGELHAEILDGGVPYR
jgi:hypothetical protein